MSLRFQNGLSSLPTHWQIKRVKDILNSDIYGTSLSSKEEGIYEILGMGDVDNGVVSFPGIRFLNSIPKELILKEGDLLLNRTNSIALVGKVGLFASSRKDVSFASYLIRLRLKKNLCDVRYYNYLFNSSTFLTHVRSLATQTANQANLNSTRYRSVQIPLLIKEEQKSISDFLDHKTKNIDRRIELLELKIQNYRKLKESIINDALFKGLAKNVKLIETKINWIGSVPIHWEIRRGKDIFKERSKKGYPDLPLLAASQKHGVVLKSMLTQKSMEAQKDFENFKLVNINDFVISLRSFEGGIETAIYKGIISPVYTVFSVKKGLLVEYYKYLFKSSAFICNLQTMITGIRDGQSIKFVEIQNTFFPIPPMEEQKEIASYLKKKTKTINSIIGNINEQIEKMKDLRKTLINDIVTGKLKVTN